MNVSRMESRYQKELTVVHRHFHHSCQAVHPVQFQPSIREQSQRDPWIGVDLIEGLSWYLHRLCCQWKRLELRSRSEMWPWRSKWPQKHSPVTNTETARRDWIPIERSCRRGHSDRFFRPSETVSTWSTRQRSCRWSSSWKGGRCDQFVVLPINWRRSQDRRVSILELGCYQRVPSEAPQSAKDATIWFTVKVSTATERTIIFPGWRIKNHTSPFTVSERRLTDVLNVSRTDTVHPDTITDHEGIRVESEILVSCYNVREGSICWLFQCF